METNVWGSARLQGGAQPAMFRAHLPNPPMSLR
jgi:hypothetical protein